MAGTIGVTYAEETGRARGEVLALLGARRKLCLVVVDLCEPEHEKRKRNRCTAKNFFSG